MAEEQKEPGRPAEFTEDNQSNFSPNVLSKLESAFLQGMNNREACFLADISEALFYRVCKNNPALVERFEQMQENIKVKAKKVIAKAIEDGDKQQANWYLERKSKDEFSTRNELSGPDGKEINVNLVNYGNNNSAQLPAPAVPATPAPSN